MNKEALQMWEQMNEMGKSTMETLLKFNEITSRSIERLAEHQLAIMGDCFESALGQMKVWSEAKGFQDLVLGQTRLAAQCGEKWISGAHQALGISLQAQTELGQWMNENLDRLGSQTRKTAAQVYEAAQQVA